jgi:hypothetical protein
MDVDLGSFGPWRHNQIIIDTEKAYELSLGSIWPDTVKADMSLLGDRVQTIQRDTKPAPSQDVSEQ